MSKNKKLSPGPAGAGQVPEVDEIDLGAALPAQTPGPEAPPPRRGRGRPRSAPVPQKPKKPRKVRKDKGIKKTPYIDNNILVNNVEVDDIDYSEIGEFKAAVDLKTKMTIKELKFLANYFGGEGSREKSALLAGYEGYSQRGLYYIGSRICRKYEEQADDHRNIARAMGAGEILVFKTLLELMQSKSEKIKLDATVNLAKILGLTKEQLEGAGGLTIIFEGPPAQAPGLPGAPLPPSQGEIKVIPAPTKPMMITK